MSETAVERQEVPWYRKEVFAGRRSLRLGRVTRIFLFLTFPIILCYSLSVKPLWQWGWRMHLYGISNAFPTRSASGAWRPGGGWITSRAIYVYGAPGVSRESVLLTAGGMASVIHEVGLNLTVYPSWLPADAAQSYRESLVSRDGKTYFDFHRFSQRRLDQRGQRYAEYVVVAHPYLQASWAVGMAYYPSGLATVQDLPDLRYVRHEGVHLLGYNLHDDFPLAVFGYHEALNPLARNTLMNPYASSDTLSPRAHDALHNYWLGAEARLGMRFFR